MSAPDSPGSPGPRAGGPAGTAGSAGAGGRAAGGAAGGAAGAVAGGADDLVNRVVAGRYRLVKRIGAGGMGAVYVARDDGAAADGAAADGADGTGGAREVALKVIKDALADNAEAAERFAREEKALRGLEHPNIVRLLGAGYDPDTRGGVRWIAMELLSGCTLKQRIATRGSLAWRDTLPVVRGIACALQAAHARGLIHRDLKPENVMLCDAADGAGAAEVKLLDFGVAKHTTMPEGLTMTATGMIVGTPGFVAPEVVLRGTSDDPRSDFYGLGATWFEMLTGAKPFAAATPFALAMRHVNERPPRPSELRPFDPVPVPVEMLLAKLLAKTPDERPPDAAALIVAIDALVAAADQMTAAQLSWAPPAPMLDSSAGATLTDMRTPQPIMHHSSVRLTPSTANARPGGGAPADGALAPATTPVPSAPTAATPMPPTALPTSLPPVAITTSYTRPLLAAALAVAAVAVIVLGAFLNDPARTTTAAAAATAGTLPAPPALPTPTAGALPVVPAVPDVAAPATPTPPQPAPPDASAAAPPAPLPPAPLPTAPAPTATPPSAPGAKPTKPRASTQTAAPPDAAPATATAKPIVPVVPEILPLLPPQPKTPTPTP